MCISDIKNVRSISLFTQEEKETYVENVLLGRVNIENLDVNQYLTIARKLSESIEEGYGNKLDELGYGSDEYSLLADLIESAYVFTGAKQYQLVREILSMIGKEEYNSKQEIIDKALTIFDKYNEQYLSIEYENFGLQAKSAHEWLKFESWNKS
jgi:hypothetical protein